MEHKRVILKSDHNPSIADLPDQILVTIFSKLPLKSILACTFVCSSFFRVTKQYYDPQTSLYNTQPTLLVQFYDEYFPSQTLTLIEPDKDLFCGFGVISDVGPRFNIPQHDTGYALVNSCDGFICLKSKSTGDPRVVCNPITGEFVSLPLVQAGVNGNIIGCGLGFCSNARIFKVLRVFKDSDSSFHAQIHSVGSSSWRSIGFAPFYPYGNLVSVHGALHWIHGKHDPKIASFDFESESFNRIPLPSEFETSNRRVKYKKTIGVCNGFLVVCYVFREGRYEIWKWMEYGNRESWSKVLDFDISGSCFSLRGLRWPLTCLENGEIVMVSDENIVFCYDLENEISRVFRFCGIRARFHAVSHTPSFRLLADSIGDGVEVMNIRPRLAREGEGRVGDSNLVEYYCTSATHKQEVPIRFFQDIRLANVIKQWETSPTHLDLSFT